MNNKQQSVTVNKPGGSNRRIPADSKRTNRGFVASEAEWNAIKEAANNTGVSISQYIREMTIVWREK